MLRFPPVCSGLTELLRQRFLAGIVGGTRNICRVLALQGPNEGREQSRAADSGL